jgi:predicted urease superfamily metal-dependent hydrolase
MVMTDATKLADALVEAGIGEKSDANWYGIYAGHPDYKTAESKPQYFMLAEDFITDWRVAGKVLELMWVDVCHNNEEFLEFVNSRINGKSIHELPRAINEALAAVEGKDDETT